MPKFLGNLDLNKNELQNVVIQPLAAAPSNPKLGQIYYDTTDDNIYRFDGTNWVTYQDEFDTEQSSTLDIDTVVTPNSNHLITSGAVSTAISNIDALPDQTGNSGKFLTTNGSAASWATVSGGDSLPSQTGNSGKFLTTDGANASWANIPEEVFVATYNSTSFSDIATAYNAGKTIICKNSSGNYCLLYRADNSRFDFALPSTTGFSWYYVDSTHWWTAGSTFVPSTRTINSKALSSNITLDASDVGAAASSHTHGNIQNNGTLQTTDVTIANGDKLVITDADATTANQVARASIVFDGSTTNKYLSPKGTWENIPSDKIFIATYDTTTYSDIFAAYNAGKICFVKYPDIDGGSFAPLIRIDTNNNVAYFTESQSSITTDSWAYIINITCNSINEWDTVSFSVADASHTHGNITNGGDITATAPTIASGDQIIINDHSASKITNGPTFDGSTTTKYLSQKGTWENVPTVPEEVFVATYNTTSYADVLAAYNAGKTLFCERTDGNYYYLAPLVRVNSTYSASEPVFAFEYTFGNTIGRFSLDNTQWWDGTFQLVPSSRTINSKNLTSDITLDASDVGAAPTSHASSSTDYGVGNNSNYGHLKLTDTISANSTNAGYAATPAAVKTAYDLANNAVPKRVSSNPGTSVITHSWDGFSISITTAVDGDNSFAVNSDSTEIHNVVTPTANGDATPKSYVDTAVNAKANKLVITTVTTSTTWNGNGPYTQTVTLANYTPTANSKIDIQPNAAALSQLMDDKVSALYVENNNGTLTMYAIGAAPTVALTLQVSVEEVASAS